MKQRISITAVLLMVFAGLTGQDAGCARVRDTLYLYSLDIRHREENQIFMQGGSKSNIIPHLKNENVDSLLASFYGHAQYVPVESTASSPAVLTCMGDSLGKKYLLTREINRSKVEREIRQKRKLKQIELVTGEVVYIYAIRIGGSFWSLPKSHPGIQGSKHSNEKNIDELFFIQQCKVPFEIDYVATP